MDVLVCDRLDVSTCSDRDMSKEKESQRKDLSFRGNFPAREFDQMWCHPHRDVEETLKLKLGSFFTKIRVSTYLANFNLNFSIFHPDFCWVCAMHAMKCSLDDDDRYCSTIEISGTGKVYGRARFLNSIAPRFS